MTFADQAFSVYGLKKWNQLPDELRVIEDLDEFKAKLKTYLYNNFLLMFKLNHIF